MVTQRFLSVLVFAGLVPGCILAPGEDPYSMPPPAAAMGLDVLDASGEMEGAILVPDNVRASIEDGVFGRSYAIRNGDSESFVVAQAPSEHVEYYEARSPATIHLCRSDIDCDLALQFEFFEREERDEHTIELAGEWENGDHVHVLLELVPGP